MQEIAKAVGIGVAIVAVILAAIALLGWVVSLCVSAVFNIEFDFMQGVALLLLVSILFGGSGRVVTHNRT